MGFLLENVTGAERYAQALPIRPKGLVNDWSGMPLVSTTSCVLCR